MPGTDDRGYVICNVDAVPKSIEQWAHERDVGGQAAVVDFHDVPDCHVNVDIREILRGEACTCHYLDGAGETDTI